MIKFGRVGRIAKVASLAFMAACMARAEGYPTAATLIDSVETKLQEGITLAWPVLLGAMGVGISLWIVFFIIRKSKKSVETGAGK